MKPRRGTRSVVGYRLAALLAVAVFAGTLRTADAAEPPPPPPNARAQTPEGFSITGQWVSIVSQNWRFRMVVPGKGEYAGIPLNLAAKQFADAWQASQDEAAGKQCKAYGAAALMRVPGRLRISWQDDNTLSVQTDAGMQTRLLHFTPKPDAERGEPGWQGYSVAKWYPFAPRGSLLGPPGQPRKMPGQMEVWTSRLLPGLLRKNGVPYSGETKMYEFWDINQEPDGTAWLTITTELEDPVYLNSRYYYTTIFMKERDDASRWNPTPCTLR